MFKCGVCGGKSQLREKARRAVLERRAIAQPDSGKPGTAIVREVLAHEECASMEGIAQAVGRNITGVIATSIAYPEIGRVR